MKVTEHLDRATRPLISFEIIPPKRGGAVSDLMRVVEDLARYEPPFIDITSHPAEVVYKEAAEGYQKRIVRKRPGTLGICALIQNKYNIDAVPHVLCRGFTQQETEDFLIELRYLGIDNVLAIQGDDKGIRKKLEHGRTANDYAVNLIQQIDAMNAGRYLEEQVDMSPTGFCIGAACYPEKHFESPNHPTDLRRTRAKVEAGAEYLVTQMFYENAHYFAFVERCREAGVEVPIIPGVKVLTRRKHLTSIPKTFHCEIPRELSDEVEAADASHIKEIGIQWAVRQVRELLEHGVPSVHIYTMLDSGVVARVVDSLGL
ncbi:MAG: methylenetetrahydrofolate reductase [Sandaracinaceae bacterium]